MKTSTFFLLLFSFSITSLYAQKKVRVEIEQPFIFEGDTLQGTLLSEGKSLDHFTDLPLLVIIPGSGPTDRNGNSILIPGPNDSFLQLADSLLKYGVASYRYDKLGVGASKMSKTEDQLRFGSNVDVAIAAIEKMKSLGFKNIYILGHSQGSLVGILVAQKEKIKGLISVAGASENAYNTIIKQLKTSLPEEMQASTIQKLDSIKTGYEVTKYNPNLAALLRPSVQPYLRSYFAFTPTEEIAKLQIPVLIIQGARDLQTSVEDAKALHLAYPGADYKVYPNMNHVLKTVDESREQNMGAYSDPDFPLARNLATDIASWIKIH